jgi:hypothetical protein
MSAGSRNQTLCKAAVTGARQELRCEVAISTKVANTSMNIMRINLATNAFGYFMIMPNDNTIPEDGLDKLLWILKGLSPVMQMDITVSIVEWPPLKISCQTTLIFRPLMGGQLVISKHRSAVILLFLFFFPFI